MLAIVVAVTDKELQFFCIMDTSICVAEASATLQIVKLHCKITIKTYHIT